MAPRIFSASGSNWDCLRTSSRLAIRLATSFAGPLASLFSHQYNLCSAQSWQLPLSDCSPRCLPALLVRPVLLPIFHLSLVEVLVDAFHATPSRPPIAQSFDRRA